MKINTVFALCSIVALLGCSSTKPLLQWQSTGGPTAQNITSVLIDDEHPATLYASLSTGDVCRSLDQGQTWSVLSTIRMYGSIYRLLQHPESRDRLFALTDAGIVVSQDRGSTWTPLPVVTGSARRCRAMAIDPFKTDLFYAGLYGLGAFRSTDGGKSWEQCKLGIDQALLSAADINYIAVAELQPDIVYAAVSDLGLLKSTDAGRTWARVTEQVTYPGTRITSIALHRKSTTDLCIGADDGYVFKSTTGGSSWALSRRGQERDGILSIAADPADPELLYAGSGSGTLVSMDFGTSWQPLSLTLPRCATSLVVSNNRQQLGLYAFGQGIGLQFSSDAGKTWVHADQGLGGSTVSALIAHRTGSDLYAVVGQAVCKYDAQKRSWQSAANGLTGGRISSIAFDPDSSSIVYVGTLNGIFQSTNAGALWQPISPSLRFTPITFFNSHPSIRTRLLISTEQGIQISTDMGSSWMRTQPTDTKFQLRTLTFSPADAGRIYGITANEDIITTLDGGFTWNTPVHSIAASGFEALTLDPGSDRISYAWTNHGEGFQSIDEGNVWRAFGVPWMRGDSVRFAVSREKPSEVVAIVNNGKIFYSNKGGATWTEIPVTTPPDDLSSLFWNGSTSTLYAGTRSNGVYQVSLKSTLAKVVPK